MICQMHGGALDTHVTGAGAGPTSRATLAGPTSTATPRTPASLQTHVGFKNLVLACVRNSY